MSWKAIRRATSVPTALVLINTLAFGAPMDRSCNASSMRPAVYEECEAKRLDERAAETRAKASALEVMARRADPKCDADKDDRAAFVGCDMGVKDMAMEAGFMREEAKDLDAQAEQHRQQAAALRAGKK